MKEVQLVERTLPQNPAIKVFVPNYKEPILPVNHGGFGWYGLQAFNEQGQLMCHECGVFRDSLSGHISKHDLSSMDYRIKYGLLCKTRLISENLRVRFSSKVRTEKLRAGRTKEQLLQNLLSSSGREASKKSRQRQRLELQNSYETCPAQLIRLLIDGSKIYGAEITARQVEGIRPGIGKHLMQRFGTFNKAKQIAKLVLNRQNGGHCRYTKRLILEDMCCFHSKYNYWPRASDYEQGKMICGSVNPLYDHYGGIMALRLEAQQLRETQEANKILAKEAIEQIQREEILQNSHARR